MIDPDGSGRAKVDLGSDPDIYLARVDWSKDGRTLYVQRESRDQKRLDLLAVDPATGASRTVLSETAKTWINLNDDFHPLKDGSFIWGSERSGFHHLYRFGGGQLTPITRGDWVDDRPRRRRRGESPPLLHRQQGRRARAAMSIRSTISAPASRSG